MDKKEKKTNNNPQNTTQKTIELKPECELMCSGRVSNSSPTRGTHRVTLVTNPVISHECNKDRIVITANRANPFSFVTQIFHNS
jgi:hypothetical protein